MIFLHILFILLIAEVWCSPPTELGKEYLYWPQYLAQEHIVNMTKEIVRDTEYKMVRAGIIHDTFKGTLDYEIGFIAAYIQNRFEHMCEVYRKSININIRRYMRLEFILADCMLVHSDYHEILVMRDLFLQVLKHFEHAGKKEKIMDSVKEILENLPSGRRADVMSIWTGPRLNKSDVEEFKHAMRSKWHVKWRNFTPAFGDDIVN